MRARLDLVDALGGINTRVSVQAQVEHLLDMLRLCRSDNMGVRNMVPPLLLRLNKDQECYDFIKWWQTTGRQAAYDYGNTSLPYLDTRNANVFESVDELFSISIHRHQHQHQHQNQQYKYYEHGFNLTNIVAVTLLKIKLMLDLEALQNTTLVGRKVPREILDGIQKHVVRSSVISLDRKLRERGDHSAYLDALTRQVYNLYFTVEMANSYFWPCLLNPGPHLAALPVAYSHGSIEEMQLVLQYSYKPWVETPGAIDIIKRIMAADVM